MGLLDRFRRDDGQLNAPRFIAPGITVHKDAVWAWVLLPTRSTDELNSEDLFQLTTDAASALRRFIPPSTEFHFKIQWGREDGSTYAAEEAAEFGGQPTPGQQAYIDLGAQRIDANQFPHRQVLLGIRLASASNDLPSVLRRTGSVGGESADFDDATKVYERSLDAATDWHRRMAASTFAARPATVRELAWAFRRDVRRTTSWLPEGPIAGGGQIARLVNDAHAVPHADHVVIDTDDGPSYLRVVAAAADGFPVTELELPGGEWLKELTLLGADDDKPIPPVELSIRGRNLSSKEAVKEMRSALALAKSQGREASEGVAEEASETVMEARAVLPVRIKEVLRGQVGMVTDSVSWIVEAPTLVELNQRSTALIDHYGDQGITLWEPKHIQDVLYRETVLGDRIRFADCQQLRPWTTLVGGWFHGGSMVGAPTGPMLGAVIGSTPGPYRNRLTNAAIEGDPVTSVFIGRSGSGKSTGVMLSVLPEVVHGAWGLLQDLKGDLEGICAVAESFGVHVTKVSTAEQASGSMDPFRYIADPAEAASRAGDNLLSMLPRSVTDQAESPIRRACLTVASYLEPSNRSSWAAILELRGSSDPQVAALGDTLEDLAHDPLARPFAGRPDPSARQLPTGPGLVYMRFNDVRMPSRESRPANWKPGERLSVALVQAGQAYALYMAGRVKGIPKLVALTELHLLTPFDFGRAFIGWLARLGRALDVSLLLDTQSTVELLAVEGLADQVSTVYAFRVKTDEEADAQARFLGLQPEPLVRHRQQNWGRGECEVRDRAGQLAPVAFDYLSTEIRAALNTTPERARRGTPELVPA